MRLFLLVIVCFLSLQAANPVLDRQLRDQRKALAALEKEVREQRQRLAELQKKETGVLENLSALDRNLGQTREYVQQLQATGMTLKQRTVYLRREVDSIGEDLSVQQLAMRKRIRELYQQGRRTEWEELWRLLQQKEDPARTVFLMGKILQDDLDKVKRLRKSLHLRSQKQKELADRIAEVHSLQKRKAEEEQGLQGQIQSQQMALGNLRDNKEAQQRALEEFEQNQQTMIALIRSLDVRRKKEEAERKAKLKAEQERLKKEKKPKAGEPGKLKPADKPKITVVTGPKCLPHHGAVASKYGMQEHAVLHTMTRNLGVEIRANRGDPVKAAAEGSVVAVQTISGRGLSVILQHGENTYSVYGHLRSVRVHIGQDIQSCQVIGEAGDDESLNGPKLYFQVSQGVQTVDPLQWLGSYK